LSRFRQQQGNFLGLLSPLVGLAFFALGTWCGLKIFSQGNEQAADDPHQDEHRSLSGFLEELSGNLCYKTLPDGKESANEAKFFPFVISQTSLAAKSHAQSPAGKN
jgi:hypothetical protein